jgi:hypothetical protein
MAVFYHLLRAGTLILAQQIPPVVTSKQQVTGRDCRIRIGVVNQAE